MDDLIHFSRFLSFRWKADSAEKTTNETFTVVNIGKNTSCKFDSDFQVIHSNTKFNYPNSLIIRQF